jgi:hypothetical protein
MLLIPKEQALQRWDTLPDNLRDALCAETNSDFIWKTCRDEHIPDEKIYAVARVVGYVLMGFLHQEDASKEIQAAIGIDPRIADSIAGAINTRIFTPLRQSIDNVYEPAGKPGLGLKTSGSGPMMIEETKTTSAPSPAPQKPILPTPGKNPETTAPKPFILQENTSLEPNKKSSDFHVEILDDKLKGLSNIPRPAPIKLAVLELGENPRKSSPVAGGTKYEGEFSTPVQLPKVPKETTEPIHPLEKTEVQISDKNRLVTEITSPLPIPAKNSSEQIISKIPLPAIPIPPKSPSVSSVGSPQINSLPPQNYSGQIGRVPTTPMQAPVQIPIEKPEQIKTTPSFSASVIQPTKIPSKPVIIQKNYSEADILPKIPTTAQAPSPKIPIPPQKN